MNETQAAMLSPEDQGRANLYALLARLLYAGADADLLRSIAAAADMLDGDEALPQAWRRLAAAAARTRAEQSVADYDDTFVGVGKAPVTPYLSHYMAAQGQEKILVDLRDELTELGLRRDTKAVEPEDHIAAVLEIMRHLVNRGDSEAALQAQRDFFARFVAPGFGGFCTAARELALADLYVGVVDLLEAFLTAEAAQFEMS